jgi:hypothetical protein
MNVEGENMRRLTAPLLILVAGMLLVAACSTTRSDDAIATDIKARMFSDSQLKDSSVQVSVSKGQVTLTGSVPSDAAHFDAFKLATDTKGVKGVNDQLAVQVAQAAPVVATPPEPTPAPEPAPVHRAHRQRVRELEATPQPPANVAPMNPPVAGAPPPPPPPPPPQPRNVEIPAGSTLRIQMIDGVDSSVNHTGETFHASLDQPIVIDNEVIVPKGADVWVRLVQASSAGHMSGRSELRLELVKMEFQGKSYPLISSTYEAVGTSRGKRTAATVGGGAALGAIIGAVAGGGKGAAIGAGVGAGSGAVYQGMTHGKQVNIPSETKLDFRLEQPVELTILPRDRHKTDRADKADNPDNPEDH